MSKTPKIIIWDHSTPELRVPASCTFLRHTDPSPAILTTTEPRKTPHSSVQIAKSTHQKRPETPADSKVQARSGTGQLHSRATSANEIEAATQK